MIALTAVSPDPARAARIANAYAKAFVSWSTATTISNLAAAESQLTRQISALGNEIASFPGLCRAGSPRSPTSRPCSRVSSPSSR